MKDIIIVGISKAGNIHLNSYKKINNIGRIFLVDNKIKSNDTKIYTTISEAVEENNLDTKNLVVDICTPKQAFMQIINQCINLGINNILVEKPFIANEEFFENHKDLKIVMIQNYLYSKITQDIKEYLIKNNMKIESIYTNLSKNRIIESMNNRGMTNGNITRNIEVEMPHQIYMANYLIGDFKLHKTLLVEEKDMIYNGRNIPKHGYAKIISKKDNILVIHESDLTANTAIREVIITCINGTIIKGEYLIYDKEFNIIQPGKMQITKNEKIILEKKYAIDDNMLECIKNAYNYFNNDSVDNEQYKNRIINFSKEIEEYLNFEKLT